MSEFGVSPGAALPNSDPRLLNRLAWVKRWSESATSVEYANLALNASAGLNGQMRRTARAHAFRTLAWQARWRGDFAEAQKFGLSAEGEVSESEDTILRADVYAILAVVHYSRGRLDLAVCATDRGFKILEEIDDKAACDAMIDLLIARATVHRLAGNMARAGLSLNKARDLAQGHDLARVEHEIARLLLAQRDVEAAMRHAEAALEQAMQSGNQVVLPYAQEVAAACGVKLGAVARAEDLLSDAAMRATEHGDRRARCQVLYEHGNLEFERDNMKTALDLYQRGRAIAKEIGYSLWEKRFCLQLAMVHEGLGDLKRSLEYHKRAWKIVESEKT